MWISSPAVIVRVANTPLPAEESVSPMRIGGGPDPAVWCSAELGEAAVEESERTGRRTRTVRVRNAARALESIMVDCGSGFG